MSKKLVRIVDIGPDDSFYINRDRLVGIIGEFDPYEEAELREYKHGHFYIDPINKHIFNNITPQLGEFENLLFVSLKIEDVE